jgi:hypothetical protein
VTALTIVQGACAVLGLPQPTSIVGSTDARVLQMLGLLRHELDSERGRHDWTGLITTVTPTLTAASGLATLALPADFKRFVPNGTIYHVTRRQKIYGPTSTADWQMLTEGTVPTSVAYWRRLGSNLSFAGVSNADPDHLRLHLEIPGLCRKRHDGESRVHARRRHLAHARKSRRARADLSLAHVEQPRLRRGHVELRARA